MSTQKIGLHVSAAGGVDQAPKRALSFKAECFQLFSRSPRGGKAPKITNEIENSFKSQCRQYKFESYVHTPYYINFASKNKEIADNSANIVKEELQRASQLGSKYVMTHLGSAKDWPNTKNKQTPNEAIDRTIQGLKKIYRYNRKYKATLLLEIAAGAGNIIGDSFEELAHIIKQTNQKQMYVCLDTAHMFASGYDIRTKKALDETMREYRKHLDINSLKLVHANDSKAGLGENKDQHEHIGKGKIGSRGFADILSHKDFQNTNFILETKHDKYIKEDIKLLKKWRTDN